MPENKFDLNKALQAAKLYNKIDYGNLNLNIPDVQQTIKNFENWRKSLGYKTEEEKQEDLKAEMQADQQRFNEQGLWNSEDPYEVYNAYQTDPEKQEEFRRNGETTAGILSTVATLPFTAGMTGGWIPAITTTVTGAAGGYAGAYGGQKLGQHLDNKYGANTTPWLSTIGGLAGGILGGGLGYKGWEGATNQYLINKAFKSGQLKYGQPTAYTAYHQSSTPITKFKFPFKERWDVRTHGADPNGAFFTVGEPAAAGFLAERPYTGKFHVKVQKPLIQTGELTGPTKNSLRNAIVRRARKNGADAVFFDGIADNQLQNQQILFAMDNADIGYRGMISTPFKRQLFWDSPKGMRNWDTQMGIARNTGNRDLMERLREKHFSINAADNKLTWENSTDKWIANSPQEQRKIVSIPRGADPSKVPSDTPVTFWHGSNESFNIFDYEKAQGMEPHFYFSTSRLYPKDFMLRYRDNNNPVIRRFYLYSKNPKRVTRKQFITGELEPTGLDWYGVNENVRLQPDADSFYGPDYLKNELFLRGEYPYKDNLPTEIAIPDNKRIKLADPLVFDDDGHFIKLSKRDNFENSDIRYKTGGKLK